MKGQPTSDSRRFLRNDAGELVGFMEYDGKRLIASYSVNGNVVEKELHAPVRKRSRTEFAERVVLQFKEHGSSYAIRACVSGWARAPKVVRSQEYVEDVPSFYRVDPQLLVDWLIKSR